MEHVRERIGEGEGGGREGGERRRKWLKMCAVLSFQYADC